jgi:hypothetical protein
MPPADRLPSAGTERTGHRRILGVDFSGASDAGHKIWIAEAWLDPAVADQPLRINACFPAIMLPQSGKTPDLAIAALANYVTSEATTIAGCDFPFSLPAELVDAASWQAFIASFRQRFPDHDAYRNDNRRRTNLLEIKRRTDRIAGTPFNSYNLRLYRQAWWGMAHLLYPLVVGNRATIVPQMCMNQGKPVLIEVCAACSLKHLDCYPSYKGRTTTHRAARKRILDCLIGKNLLQPPTRALRRLLLENTGGDALDAVIGAIATSRADITARATPIQRLEGRVFFELPQRLVES